MKIIYLDNAATTQCYKEVVKEMNLCFSHLYGNPNSTHAFGEKARELVNNSRKVLANEISAGDYEIIFTSGATESINLAIKGLASKSKRGKLIISKIEHSAVYETCMHLKAEGYDVVEIGVDKDGLLDLKELERNIDERTMLVSVIHVNNELGVVQNLEEIGKICAKKKVLFHVDAAQSFGKLNIDVNKMGISLLSASAHKIHGPKGVGLLFIKKGLELEPIIYGAGQEKGIRSGTENVAGIVGFSTALELIRKADKNKIKKLRDYFVKGLEKIGGNINGSTEKRIYNNINVCFSVDSETLIAYLSSKGIMVSTRSACSSRDFENRVLKAVGLSEKKIRGSFRIVLSEFNTKNEIDYALKEIKNGMKTFG